MAGSRGSPRGQEGSGEVVVRSVTAPAPAGEWNMTLVFDLRFHAINGMLVF
jgi:hypothetical protein